MQFYRVYLFFDQCEWNIYIKYTNIYLYNIILYNIIMSFLNISNSFRSQIFSHPLQILNCLPKLFEVWIFRVRWTWKSQWNFRWTNCSRKSKKCENSMSKTIWEEPPESEKFGEISKRIKIDFLSKNGYFKIKIIKNVWPMQLQKTRKSQSQWLHSDWIPRWTNTVRPLHCCTYRQPIPSVWKP